MQGKGREAVGQDSTSQHICIWYKSDNILQVCEAGVDLCAHKVAFKITEGRIGMVQGAPYGQYPPPPPGQAMYVQHPQQQGGMGGGAGQGCLAACLVRASSLLCSWQTIIRYSLS